MRKWLNMLVRRTRDMPKLNTQAYPGFPSMGVKVKMGSETIIPKLVELPDKCV
jgi:hypothetical protein